MIENTVIDQPADGRVSITDFISSLATVPVGSGGRVLEEVLHDAQRHSLLVGVLNFF